MDKYSWVGRMGVAFLAVFFCSASLAGTYSGGDGSPGAPYQIGTVQDWFELIASESDWDKHFELIADIDFGGAALTPVAPGVRSHLGRIDGTPFTGTFEGNGNTLRNAMVSLPNQDFVGLFGWCAGEGDEGAIRNLTVLDVTVSGRFYVGILAGRVTTVSDCHVQGTVSGFNSAGLLAGRSGSIDGCTAEGTVMVSNAAAGGLVGTNHGSIALCYTSGMVQGIEFCQNIGGLAGENHGSIHASNSSALVSAPEGHSVGGLVGSNSRGIIVSAFATGNVTGDEWVGGLVGKNDLYGSVTASYAMGTVTGNNEVGGLIGKIDGYAEVHASYAAGTVTGSTFVGGLVGAVNTGVAVWGANFWDEDATLQVESAIGLGLTTIEMKEFHSFSNANWAAYDWVMSEGAYPRLSWEGLGWDSVPPPPPLPLDGNGTESEPYLIHTVSDFLMLSTYASAIDKHFLLMDDLDFSGVSFYPISSFGRFSGTFDGNGRRLMNLEINLPGGAGYGIFDHIDADGVVKDLHLQNIAVSGGNQTGALAAMNEGQIRNCTVEGTVLGGDYTGGLVGVNKGGKIIDCHTSCSVSGGHYTGGLVGTNTSFYGAEHGEITLSSASGTVLSNSRTVGGLAGHNDYTCAINSSHATGEVTGEGGVGGLVGSNYGSVEDCYAMGNVVGLNNSGNSEGVGGLAGFSAYGTLINCYATGMVTGNLAVGGLAGVSGLHTQQGAVRASFATGNVSGVRQVGGLVGKGVDIIACYATGAVQGEESVGGLAGEARVVIASYATGVVSGEAWVGGLAGACWNRGWDSFWDTDTSGIPRSATGKGIPSARMRSLEVFRNANWAAHDWVMEPGFPPRLAWEGLGWAPIPPPPPLPLAGSGTSADPYRVTSASEFALLSWHYFPLDAHFRLMRDIDLAGVALYPIRDGYGNSTGDLIGFAGVFEGGGHRIRNASILGADHQPGNWDHIGLFARVAEEGIIRNLTLENVAINAPGYSRYAGALAGRSAGHLHACTVSGSISGDGFIGGAAGSNSGAITFCRAEIAVTAGIMDESNAWAGGLAGENFGDISGSSATGAVAGFHAGGLTGMNAGLIVASHGGAAVTGRTAGGLVGAGAEGRIERSSASGNVTGIAPPDLEWLMPPAVGGLVGALLYGDISMCYAAGDVSGFGMVGGLVGQSDTSMISDAYARGHVRDLIPYSHDSWLGGLVAYTAGPGLVARCYAAGRMTRLNPASMRGGLVAQQVTVPMGPLDGQSPLAAFYHAYWNTQLSGVTTSAAGEGRNTSAMTYPYAQNTYVEWDFGEVWAADEDGTVNGGYPWLPGAVYAPPAQVAISGSPRAEKGDYMVLSVSLPPSKGNVTIDWYKDGVLIWSDGDPDYIIPYATEEDSGVYYAIITDEDDTCHRTPNFIVRVFEEGSLPVAHPLCLMLLSLLLIACAGRCAKRRSRCVSNPCACCKYAPLP